MSDTPATAPDFNTYAIGKSSPAEDGLNTTSSTLYDFSDNPCRFFIAQSNGNVNYTSAKGSTLTISVLANIKYPIRISTIIATTSADLLCLW
jgi:hypothetical protein